MSYDFLMFKPKRPLASVQDITEEAVLMQEPEVVVGRLQKLYPQARWERSSNGGWFGSLDGPDGRYEFLVSGEPDHAWSIHTSHRASERSLIEEITRELGVIAFDGQAGILIPSPKSD